MIPTKDMDSIAIEMRLETNQSVAISRLMRFLSALERMAQNPAHFGPTAKLGMFGVRHGSIITMLELLAAAGALATIATFMLAVERQISSTRKRPPTIADAAADMMLKDGVTKIEFIVDGRSYSLHRDNIPFVQKVESGDATLSSDEPKLVTTRFNRKLSGAGGSLIVEGKFEVEDGVTIFVTNRGKVYEVGFDKNLEVEIGIGQHVRVRGTFHVGQPRSKLRIYEIL